MRRSTCRTLKYIRLMSVPLYQIWNFNSQYNKSYWCFSLKENNFPYKMHGIPGYASRRDKVQKENILIKTCRNFDKKVTVCPLEKLNFLKIHSMRNHTTVQRKWESSPPSDEAPLVGVSHQQRAPPAFLLFLECMSRLPSAKRSLSIQTVPELHGSRLTRICRYAELLIWRIKCQISTICFKNCPMQYKLHFC